MKDLLTRAALLFLLWFVLSGQSDLFHLGAGLLSALAVAWLAAHGRGGEPGPFPWRRLLVYLPWLFARIVLSNLHVAALALDPRLPIAPRLIRYRTALAEPAARVLLANSITLTPGTITAELDGDELVVHALDEASASDLETGLLEQKVAWVFARTG
ncbi:Na+/H+ antiporter subunit E [Nitrospira sp. Kam-Ns4a]